jgi:hypothetical protein
MGGLTMFQVAIPPLDRTRFYEPRRIPEVAQGHGELTTGRETLVDDSARTEFGLFDSGTIAKLRMHISPIGNSVGNITKLAGLTILVGWVPLLILATFQTAADPALGKAFLSDIAVSCRSLIAAPLLVLAVQPCLPRLTEIARNFRDSGIVADHDLSRFDRAWSSTLKWCNFIAADIAIVALAYAIVLALIDEVPAENYPAWYATPRGGHGPYSLAGWWHAAISLPLLLILILGWFWRVVLWARFLFLVSRLELRLMPAHPDQTAGLRFVGYSAQSFSLVALAFGCVAAGSAANRILLRGAEPQSLVPVLAILVVTVLLTFAGPLVVFFPHLLRAWRRGVIQYGSLASRLGQEFERKWLSGDTAVDPSALEVEDFSATTDLYQVASNVYEVRLFPAGWMSLAMLVASAIAPFAAIALLFVPTDVIVKELIALLS